MTCKKNTRIWDLTLNISNNILIYFEIFCGMIYNYVNCNTTVLPPTLALRHG